jgi:hypothetical protein
MTGKSARLFAIFLLSAILLNYPILGVFSKPQWIKGFPSQLVYLFVIWFLVILTVRFTIKDTPPQYRGLGLGRINKKKKKN